MSSTADVTAGVKIILLHLAGDPSGDPGANDRFTSTASLARRFGARLVGLSIEAPYYPLGVEGSGALSDVYARIAAESEAESRARVKAFQELATSAGLDVEGRAAVAPGGGAGSIFALHGRYADLCVVGAPDGEDSAISQRVLEGALFDTGRPVILLPEKPHDFSADGLSRIMIAWDGRKEAARAVHDALPFLLTAKEVEICVVEGGLGGGDYGQEPGADCARWLAAHGVSPTVQQVSRTFGVAKALLDRSFAMGAQMIVMGGYGHSRLSEAIFGGVTESLLSEAKAPLFMAH
ncbi:MAG: universal stress protein [Pseudomonadota bacterium]